MPWTSLLDGRGRNNICNNDKNDKDMNEDDDDDNDQC
jgi:hypothetical protein